MKRAILSLLGALAMVAAPALAAGTFVYDDGNMFSPSTVAQLNARIGNFNAQTGKEIVVQTVASVPDGDVRAAAENAFAQHQVNGVLMFVDKGDRKDWIIPDRAATQAGWWNTDTSRSIAQSMEAQFRAGDYDGGIVSAVSGALNVYRSHLGSLRGNGAAQPSYGGSGSSAQTASSGGGISVFWWIIIALIAFFVIRSILRAASGPRYYGGAPGTGPGGPGYGPGAGYGYGWGGGGGGFWSGLLGGLGGAWLGNELFSGNRGVGTGAWGNVDPTGGAPATPGDAGGWQADPGQADVGGSAGGDWGGGGFGGGDFGGGGGGDFGGGFGGGGDAGGSW